MKEYRMDLYVKPTFRKKDRGERPYIKYKVSFHVPSELAARVLGEVIQEGEQVERENTK